MSNISDIYQNTKDKDNKPKPYTLKIKGKADNNVVFEDSNGDILDLSTSAYIKKIEKDLERSNNKIKKLESTNSRLNYEIASLRSDVNTLKRILNRN